MAGKKAAAGVSKKTVQKVKERIVEDKTFGLKNKNKSKKVQKFINSVQSQVDARFNDKRAEQKKKAKEEARLAELELFNQIKIDQRRQDTQAEVRQRLEEEEPIDENLPIPEQLEKLRARMKQGTPCTRERFQEWMKKRKDQREQEKLQKQKKMQLSKKAGPKSDKSGRSLFEFDASMFVDDEDALDDDEGFEGYESSEDEQESGAANADAGGAQVENEELFADADVDLPSDEEFESVFDQAE